MKKLSLYISAVAICAAALTGCDDNWVTPPMDVPTEGSDIEATLTIAELKAMYWQDQASYGTPVTALPDGQHAIIKGTIVSSTESGNIYKAVYVQDSTAAICIGIDTTAVNAVLPMGVGIAIDVTGLQIGRYSGAMQLGKADGSSVNRITYKELKPHLYLDYWSGKLDTTVVSLEEIKKPSQNMIRELGGKLVRINNVKFQEAGQDFAEGTNTSRTIQDSIGNSIIVYDSPYADFAYDTMPYGYGDVVGILSNYNTNWQLLLIDINGVIGFTGEGTPDDDAPAPELPEQYKDALSVQQALDIIASGNIPTDAQMVFGRISSIVDSDFSTQYGNLTYYIQDPDTRKTLEVYRGYWLNGDKFTSPTQMKTGEYVIVEGVLVNYNGKTPEITQGSKVLYYFGDTETPSEPENPGDVPTVPTEIMTVAEALAYIAAGGEANNAQVQVKGIISKINDVDTGQYGNATYFIKDELSDADEKALEIYRGYWLGGAKFTSKDQIEVGAEVIVEGKLVNYNGTYEFTSGSKIISYNGQTAPENPGDDTPTVPDTPIEPGTPGTAYFDFTHPETLNPSYPADKGSTPDNGNTCEAVSGVVFQNNGVGVSATKGSMDARIYYQSSGKIQYRIYNGSTLTVTSSLPITSIQFEFNQANSSLTGADGVTYSNENPQALPNGATSMTFSASASTQINTITVVTAE